MRRRRYVHIIVAVSAMRYFVPDDGVGPGKMTDWRDIVEMIESFSTIFHLRHSSPPGSGSGSDRTPSIPKALNPPLSARKPSSTSQNSTIQLPDEFDDRKGYTGSHAMNDEVEREQVTQGSGASSSGPGGYWDRFWR